MRGSIAAAIVFLVVLILFVPFLSAGTNTAAQIYAEQEKEVQALPSSIQGHVTGTVENAVTLGEPLLDYRPLLVLAALAALVIGLIIWGITVRYGPAL